MPSKAQQPQLLAGEGMHRLPADAATVRGVLQSWRPAASSEKAAGGHRRPRPTHRSCDSRPRQRICPQNGLASRPLLPMRPAIVLSSLPAPRHRLPSSQSCINIAAAASSSSTSAPTRGIAIICSKGKVLLFYAGPDDRRLSIRNLFTVGIRVYELRHCEWPTI